MTNIPARHELLMFSRSGWHFAECTCNLWRSNRTNLDQLVEDYQVHRDVIDEAARYESQRLDDAAGRAVNMGAK